MKRLTLLFILAIGLLLAGCSSAISSPTTSPAVELTELPSSQPSVTLPQTTAVQPVQPTSPQADQFTELTDSQGAVTVSIKPLNLNSAQDMLNFEVTLNTHSVDLSMDLAPLATLKTDTGISVQAAVWDAPLGGHHVSGKLSFPASVEGKRILDGASKITLTIKDLGGYERVFTWDL